MLRRILVPLDGSRFAEKALPTAFRLSRRDGAQLELVMVQ
jgi:nucleotide-binding universal stress UspA family protein